MNILIKFFLMGIFFVGCSGKDSQNNIDIDTINGGNNDISTGSKTDIEYEWGELKHLFTEDFLKYIF